MAAMRRATPPCHAISALMPRRFIVYAPDASADYADAAAAILRCHYCRAS